MQRSVALGRGPAPLQTETQASGSLVKLYLQRTVGTDFNY